MIRFITSAGNFIEIKKHGFLRPGIDSDNPAVNYIAFEKEWAGDSFFKAVYIKRNSISGVYFQPNELTALLFNEHDLLVKGYILYDLPKEDEEVGLKSMLLRKEISQKEFDEIGNFICIRDIIPLTYMTNIDIPDKDRLNRIGLI